MYIDLSDDANGRICLNAAAADKLKETVDITVNLASNTPASFDGSGDVVPGVYGILNMRNGGTGSNENHEGYTNLLSQGKLTDANTDFKRGLYYYSPGTSNIPDENGYGAIYNFIGNPHVSEGVPLGNSTGASWLWQIGFDTENITPFIRKSINAQPFSEWVHLASLADVDARMGDFLPRSAGESKKLTGPLGLTKDVMYGTTLPASGFDGQLFFLEDDGATLPTGGNTGYALVKNSNADGDASWKSSQITWAAGTSNGPKPKIFGIKGTAIPAASTTASGIITTSAQTFAGEKTFNSTIQTNGYVKSAIARGGTWIAGTHNASFEASVATTAESGQFYQGWFSGKTQSGAWSLGALSGNEDLYFVYGTDANYNAGTNTTVQATRIEASTGRLLGAAWNDYAEFRTQIENIEPGYCVASVDNGKVYKTTEKLQACDGIVSDTFGFAIGETDECKTPLAVAGRVLVYFHGNREDYHSGDTVCAGPEGKVIKMTREEIKEYPDRIVGIVSEIPEYETWGTGNILVNNRIWIKVK